MNWLATVNWISHTPICRWLSTTIVAPLPSIPALLSTGWILPALTRAPAMPPTRSRHFERPGNSTRFRRMRPGGLGTSSCGKDNRVPEAFQQIHDALAVDSKLTVSAISVCWSSTRDIDQILKTVLPDEPDENWGAIQSFVQAREPLAAIAVWKRIAAHHDSFPAADAFPLLDMLIATGHVDEARVVWNQALQAAGVPRESGASGSLVWNGGFENDPLDGGFDWRFLPVEGAEIRWDEEDLRWEGGRCAWISMARPMWNSRTCGSMCRSCLPQVTASAPSSGRRI